MLYLIGYLLTGEAVAYHTKLADELAAKLGEESVSRRIPPHLTLKIPFTASLTQVAELKMTLQKFTQQQHPAPLILRGFGDFNQRVAFLDVVLSAPAVILIDRLTEELAKLPWLKLEPHDRERKLHATLAYTETPEQFKTASDQLAPLKPDFPVVLDNLAILQKEDKTWTVASQYQFSKPL